MLDSELIALAKEELSRIDVIDPENILDATVIKTPKAYPAYFRSYDHFDEIKKFTNGFTHLFLIGRHRMNHYNNSDHSVLTAMMAVDNIGAEIQLIDNIWTVHTETDYNEEISKSSQDKLQDDLIEIMK